MSEKLLPCPFCGGEARTFEYDGANQATCGGKHIDCAGTDVVAPVAMWNRRTPAPEGEAWRTVPVEPTEGMMRAAELAGLGDPDEHHEAVIARLWSAMLAASPVVPAPEGEAVAWRLRRVGVVRWNLWDLDPRVDTPAYADAAEWEVQPLYASPVVPVGVSREAIAALRDELVEARTLDKGFYEWMIERDLLVRGEEVEWGDIVVALTEHEIELTKADERQAAEIKRLREAITVAAVELQLAGGWLREAGAYGPRVTATLDASNNARAALTGEDAAGSPTSQNTQPGLAFSAPVELSGDLGEPKPPMTAQELADHAADAFDGALPDDPTPYHYGRAWKAVGERLAAILAERAAE
jgi:hypothetical protein